MARPPKEWTKEQVNVLVALKAKKKSWDYIDKKITEYSRNTIRRKWDRIVLEYPKLARNSAHNYGQPAQNTKAKVDQKLNGLEYTNFDKYYEEDYQPELLDTRTWDWATWADYFMDIRLADNQIDNLKRIEDNKFNLINDPRRYGKTTVVISCYTIRKLCETVWADGNEFIAYMSAVKSNVEHLSLMIITNLTFNERILQNYGYLIKETSRKGRKLQKNTMTEITLKTRKIPFGSSYVGFMVSGRFRGAGAKYVLIDDPVDTFEEKHASLKLQTSKLINTIKSRIIPVCQNGQITVIGTRYNLEDCYYQLEQEGFWQIVTRKALAKHNFVDGYTLPTEEELGRKPKASDVIVHDESEWEILMPFRWGDDECTPLQHIIFTYLVQGDRIFSCEYQNEPKPLVSVMNWEDFVEVDFTHPANYADNPSLWYNQFQWCAFFDDASGESEGSDYRALVLCATRGGQYYLIDQLYFRDIASAKLRRIGEFIRTNETRYGVQISLLIEVVRNQRETFQRLRDESDLVVQAINPRGRGDKSYRIQNNFAVLLEQGKLHLNKNIRQQRQLKMEVEGFPHVHPDGLDAWDQCVFWLTKHSSMEFKVWTPGTS